MKIPKFLIGDHTEHPDDIFVIHTEFPRFIINLVDDGITWQEDIGEVSQQDLEAEMATLIKASSAFYDEQVAFYDKE